jgi:aryl-alcohol dehydrogenase-like predicted oxidoreductase
MPTTSLPARTIGSGDDAIEVSLVGLGCNNFGGRLDLDGTRAVLDAALEAGVTLFDTADIYGGGGGSEQQMGEALEGRRDEFVLATKFGMEMRGVDGVPDVPRGSREYVRWAIEGSLERLRTDRIDLYQYHQPDGVTPIAETLEAMHELVEEGRVRLIGCSNFTAAQLEEAEQVAAERGLTRFVTLQNEYSLLEREIEADVQPACERLGVGILPYFPLASGLLSGKYRRDEQATSGRLSGRDQAGTPEQFDVVEALEAYASERDVELIDVAIAGLAAQPAVVSVIAGATKPEQIRRNVAALEAWSPTEGDLRELDRTAPTPRAA